MGGDDFVRGQAHQGRDLGQVLAVIGHGDLDRLRPAGRRRGAGGGLAGQHGAGQRGIGRHAGIGGHHQRAGGGHDLGHARDGIGRQRVEQRQRRVQIGQLDQEGARPDGQDAGHACHRVSGTSVTNMCPGAWVMAKGGREAMTAACGVTPQAQKTGT